MVHIKKKKDIMGHQVENHYKNLRPLLCSHDSHGYGEKSVSK